jgi:hypothetical protein
MIILGAQHQCVPIAYALHILLVTLQGISAQNDTSPPPGHNARFPTSSLKVSEMLIPLVAQFLCIRIPVATLGLIIVEIPRISGAPQMRHNRALDLTIIQAAGATTNVSEALGSVHGAEAGDQVAGVGGHGRGEADFAFYNSERVC